MVIATWEKGFASFYKGVSAQAVAEEIISIGDSATPQQIVDKARDKKTQLHRCFTWDNKVAAERWRTQEARLLVRHLMIERKDDKPDAPQVRYFHRADDYSGYKPCFTVFTREDEYAALLRRALCELQAFQIKYKVLADRPELLALIGAAEEMLESA